MKEKYTLTKADDLTLTPSDALNEDTLAKMAAAGKAAPGKRKKITRARILSCAALVGAMFMLMGAGYRMFSYLAYVPGQGIVMQEIDRVYTLKKAVEAGEYYIEAASMVPVVEGEHKGKWEVSVMVSHPLVLAELPETITLQGGENTQYTLERQRANAGCVRYTGFMDSAAAGTWTVGVYDGKYPVSLTSAAKSDYNNIEYPTSDGITFICLPMAENSDRLVVDFDLSGVSEELAYWMAHSQSFTIDPSELTVIDTKGNTYTRGSSSNIPITAKQGYSMETILWLDRRLEAPVAQIRVENLQFYFSSLYDMEEYSLTIPAFGETVSLENEYLVDDHGVRVALYEAESGVCENRKFIQTEDYNALFIRTRATESYFTEPIWNVVPRWRYRLPGETVGKTYESYRDSIGWAKPADTTPQEENFQYKENVVLIRDTGIHTDDHILPACFGDTVYISMDSLSMWLDGTWEIDFTKNEDKGIPKEAIKYGR